MTVFPHPRRRRRQGQTRARARRPQRADAGRRGRRRLAHRAQHAPTITEIADNGGKVILLSHFGRPKGRDPKESLKPVVAAVARIIGRPIAFAEDCVGEVAEQAVAAHEARRHSLPGEHPLPQRRGKERSGFRRRARPARRHLCRRRVLGRAPGACLGRGDRASAAGLCRPRHAGGTRGAGEGAARAGAPGRGDRRRRQNLDQARSARQSDRQGRDADHRRRHGQYLPRRARQGRRQIAVRERSRCRPRATSWPRQSRSTARSCCRSTPSWRRSSPRMSPRASSRSTRSAPPT